MAYYYSGTNCTFSSDTLIFTTETPVSLPIVVSRGDKPGCYTLTNEVFSPPTSYLFGSTFTNCRDCLVNVFRSFTLTDCRDNQSFSFPISVINSFPFVPQGVLLYSYIFHDLKGGYYSGCYFINYSINKSTQDFIIDYISPSSYPQENCELCQQSIPIYYEVFECLTNTSYVVTLPPGVGGNNYGVTFTIDSLGIDLYCGILKQTTPRAITATVISVIGFIGDTPEAQQIFCEECVASGATKVVISNCLDGSTEVIWGSNLFNPGDVSNISLGGGQCYEILSATTAPVTINELLNYEPSPTCTDCLNCEQVELFVQVCGDITAFPIISSQYVPFGTIISDGSTCYEVQNASPVDVSGVTTIVSFATFNTCPECEDASFQRWVGTSCNDGHADFIVLTGTSSYVPGQIVQVQRNGSDFTCYTLQYTAEGEVPPLPNTPNYYYSLTQIPFNTCAECSSGSTVGITIIDCDYASASYVTVSLYDYLRLTGGDGNPATPVLQYDGKCHLLLNECPIDNTYPLVTSTLYNNCIECSADLNLTRYSGITCFSQEPINVIYNETNILTPGTIILTNNGTCVTISGETNETNTEGTITTTGLTSCYECYLNDDPNYQVFFQSCLDGEVYFIPLNLIGFLPLLGERYYLDITIEGKPFQSCFTVVGLEPLSNSNTVLNSISVPYVDCAECFTNNLIRYRVQDCVSGDIHVIGYPSTGLNNLVTYTPIGEVDQYCGIVLEITTTEPIDSSLITILGKVSCEDCLSAVAKKRILTNCLNGNQEVVWGSILFSEGNITHIQTGEGCYEIGPETELEVTLNEFLDFDNYPSCQECIQCNGVHYFYSACTSEYNVTSVSSLSVGFYNQFITYQSSTNIIFVSDSFNRIALYDATTNVNLNNYYAPVQIQTFFFLHPTNGLIYFVNSNTLRAFNTSTGAFSLIYTYLPGNSIRNYFYDPITNYMWLTIWDSRINIINLTTNTLVTTISLPYFYPEGITYNPNNDKVYVEDIFNPFFYVIDRISYTYTTHSLGYYYSNNIIYDNTTNRIFGSNHYIDCATLNVFNFNFNFNDILIDPISNYLIGWEYSGGILRILNPTTLQVNQYLTQSTPPNPQFITLDFTYNSNTNEYYVSSAYWNVQIITLTFGDLYRLGEIDSYQYAPLDSYFHHPKDGCSIIYDILPSSGVTSHSFYSFENFDTCEDCTNVQFDVWEAYNCVTNRLGYITTQTGLYTQNDLVNVKWGETDFVCYRLSYLIPPQDIVYFNNINNRDNFIAESLVKPTCENCSDGTNVAISIIDCSNQNSMFINVSLSVWFILTGYNDTIPRPVFLFGDTCYKVLNECPFSPDHYTFNPSYIYFNCESCNQPLEANSETVLCLQNCSGGTYTVSVNHPYWTNQYGKTVIQNNAVGLGGQTGYNA